jgi:hypothetical protein
MWRVLYLSFSDTCFAGGEVLLRQEARTKDLVNLIALTVDEMANGDRLTVFEALAAFERRGATIPPPAATPAGAEAPPSASHAATDVPPAAAEPPPSASPAAADAPPAAAKPPAAAASAGADAPPVSAKPPPAPASAGAEASPVVAEMPPPNAAAPMDADAPQPVAPAVGYTDAVFNDDVRQRAKVIRTAAKRWDIMDTTPDSDGFSNAQYLRQHYEAFTVDLQDERLSSAMVKLVRKLVAQLYDILARTPEGADDGKPLPPLTFVRERQAVTGTRCGFYHHKMQHPCKGEGHLECVFKCELVDGRDDDRGRCGKHCPGKMGFTRCRAKPHAKNVEAKRSAEMRSPLKPQLTKEEAANLRDATGAASGAAGAAPLVSKRHRPGALAFGAPQLPALPAAAGKGGRHTRDLDVPLFGDDSSDEDADAPLESSGVMRGDAGAAALARDGAGAQPPPPAAPMPLHAPPPPPPPPPPHALPLPHADRGDR